MIKTTHNGLFIHVISTVLVYRFLTHSPSDAYGVNNKFSKKPLLMITLVTRHVYIFFAKEKEALQFHTWL